MAKAVSSMRGLRELEKDVEDGPVDFTSAQRFLTVVGVVSVEIMVNLVLYMQLIAMTKRYECLV